MTPTADPASHLQAPLGIVIDRICSCVSARLSSCVTLHTSLYDVFHDAFHGAPHTGRQAAVHAALLAALYAPSTPPLNPPFTPLFKPPSTPPSSAPSKPPLFSYSTASGTSVDEVALPDVLELLQDLHGLGVDGVAITKPQFLWAFDDCVANVCESCSITSCQRHRRLVQRGHFSKAG